jgi:hypothetical protein
MKTLLLALTLACPLSFAFADDVLKNSDFSEGAQYWHGDGHTPADIKSSADALDTPVDYGDKGLVIQLKPHQWTKITQAFKDCSAEVTLKITYKVAPNTTFSQKDDDYTNVTHSVDYDAWPPITERKNGWVIFVTDPTNYNFFDRRVSPRFDSTESQNYTENFSPLDPHDEKTLTLCFPPGTGAIILLSVTIESH